jgi:hypothetical protein
MICLGIDIGKKLDPSAMVEVSGELDSNIRTVGACMTLPLGMSYTDQAKLMARRGGDGPGMVVIDAGGVGDVVFELVRHLLSEAPVWGLIITGGAKARVNREHRTAHIPKRVMVNHLAAMLDHDRLRFSDVKDAGSVQLIAEMRDFKRHANGKMEAALGRHDDLLMALCMALMGFRIRGLVG